MVTDISAEMAEIEDMGESHIAVVWDFKSAHRLVQVAAKEWGLQARTLVDLRGQAPAPEPVIYVSTRALSDFRLQVTGGAAWPP